MPAPNHTGKPRRHAYLNAPQNLLTTSGSAATHPLTLLGARSYDPSIGRFLSVDPLLTPTDPQSINGYAYADNNPITNSDPTGTLCNNGPDGSCHRNGENLSTGNGGGGSGSGNGLVAAPTISGTTPEAVLQQYAVDAANERRAEQIQQFLIQFHHKFHDSFFGGLRDFAGGIGDFALDSLGAMNPVEGLITPYAENQFDNAIGVDKSDGVYKAGYWIPAGLTALATGGESAAVDVETAGSKLPGVIYREGALNPANLTPRASDAGALSFRDSLSNPIGSAGRPVLRPGKQYFGIDTSRLPSGSVIVDNNPAGHVSVTGVSPEQLKNAVMERGVFPK